MRWSMAIAWKSASTSDPARAARGLVAARLVLAACVFVAALAGTAAAEGGLDRVTGHLSVGYARAFIAGSPGGSISVGAGLDFALTLRLGVGSELGYDLLGARDVQRDTLFGTIDYNTLQGSLRLSWAPAGWGPIRRLSVGPLLMKVRGEVQTPYGGLPFDDLSVHEVAPGVAWDATLMTGAVRPVRVGLEIGSRLVFLDSQTWSLAQARLAFHY